MNRTQRLFLGRSWREWRLLAEALGFLLWAKVSIHTIPFRRLALRFGLTQKETAETISPAERAIAVDISWAVQAAARHVPLRLVCLPQAVAAQRMLRRRGLPSTLYLGVAPNRANKDAIGAHAWLRAGDKIVTGEVEMRAHRALAWFADVPTPRSSG